VVSPVEEVKAKHLLNKVGVTAPYLLYLGHLERRKNLENLVDAFFRSKRAGRKTAALHLVVAGRAKADYGASLLTALSRHHAEGEEPCVHFPGEVDEETRTALLAGAFMVLQPSRYEGFNLGVLEAMAVGIPVACSDIPAHREVGGEAVAFFPPDSPEAMAEVITGIASNPDRQRTLEAQGRKRATLFNWDSSAEKLRRIWSDLCGRPE
jgi:alpha-1,3-rhamnosyl/mannosyltransferase